MSEKGKCAICGEITELVKYGLCEKCICNEQDRFCFENDREFEKWIEQAKMRSKQ